ncbi:MAG TPA: GNAT family N-acetyltransferase [Haliangium sp.]|nr:GNAT family N-acetyltransferase [Haliangium sp.]
MRELLDTAALDTPRAVLRLAVSRDEADLAVVFGELMPLFERTGRAAPAMAMARGAIEHEILPPGGSRERARTFVIRARAGHEIAGVLGYYVGYPEQDALYVSQLFLRPRWQGMGLGREVMGALEQRADGAGAREIRLGVDPDNWGALRFWVRVGYDRIARLVDVPGLGAAGPPRFELRKAGAPAAGPG